MLSVIMSGLNVAQKDLSVTANNLANANTVGFKRSDVSFLDLFANDPSSAPRMQVGMGATTGDVAVDVSAGGVRTTARTSDLAISGRGYFVMSGVDAESGVTSTVYTRAGDFSFDPTGRMIDNAGRRLQCFPIVDGTASQARTVDATIAPEMSPARMRVTLGAGAVAGSTVTLSLDGATLATHQVTASEAKAGSAFVPAPGATSANAASVAATYPVTLLNVPLAGVAAQAGRSIRISSASGQVSEKNLTQEDVVRGFVSLDAPPSTAVDGLVARYVDGSQESVVAGPISSSASVRAAEAAYQGDYLQSISIDPRGLIEAVYGSGAKQAVGALAIALFPNDGGLRPTGDADFIATSDSGEAVLTRAGEPDAGEIMSGALEQANVDMTRELTSMMKAQQVYNGNARMLQTAVELTTRIIDKI